MATPQRGGYDYQFVDTPLDMFLCKICHFPSKEPHLSTCCGHTFCKSCLDGTISPLKTNYFAAALRVCPMCRSNGFKTFLNKQNERAINSLRVFCTNKDKGCDWEGELNDITGHLRNSNGCQFEEVKCSNDCGLLLQRQHLPSHVDNECPCREVHCQYCSMVGQHQVIIGRHVEECPKVPLPCPNSCGVDSIFREDMEFHKTTCPLEDIECPNDCGEVLHRQSMTKHIEAECSRRKVNCRYCQLLEEYQVIERQHKEECPKFPMNCPNECEIGSVPREDIVTHRLKCPLEVIECTYYSIGCRNTMARKDWCKHEKEKMEEHLHLTSSKLTECQTKIDELESEVKQNKALLRVLFGEWAMELNIKALQSSTGDQVLPVVLQMPDYASNKNWYSSPFYTHDKGYKMKLRVNHTNYSKYLSVHLCLMQGPYDNELSWPLTDRFQIKLLDQAKDGPYVHHSRTASVNDATMVVTDKVTSREDTNVCIKARNDEVTSHEDAKYNYCIQARNDEVTSREDTNVCIKARNYKVTSREDTKYNDCIKARNDKVTSREDTNDCIKARNYKVTSRADTNNCIKARNDEVTSHKDAKYNYCIQARNDEVTSREDTNVCIKARNYKVTSREDTKYNDCIQARNDEVTSREDTNVCIKARNDEVTSRADTNNCIKARNDEVTSHKDAKYNYCIQARNDEVTSREDTNVCIKARNYKVTSREDTKYNDCIQARNDEVTSREDTNVCIKARNDEVTSRKDTNDCIKEVWDDLQFIKITPLPLQFLKNDSLFFEVSKISEINRDKLSAFDMMTPFRKVK